MDKHDVFQKSNETDNFKFQEQLFDESFFLQFSDKSFCTIITIFPTPGSNKGTRRNSIRAWVHVCIVVEKPLFSNRLLNYCWWSFFPESVTR